MPRRTSRAFITLLLGCAPAAAPLGGEFGVSPIRVDLDRNTRTSVVKVSNDEKNPLFFQIRAMEWTQDAEGNDKYAESSDLVYFPQQMEIPGMDNRVVRVGYRNPALNTEKAYRLYIEEMPKRSYEQGKATVDIQIRFGVPVFLRPPTVVERGEIRSLAVRQGRAETEVENLGSVHFRIARVTFEALGASGEKLFAQEVPGWYLLAGAMRRHGVDLPKEVCAKTARLRSEVASEKVNLRREIEVRPDLCS